MRKQNKESKCPWFSEETQESSSINLSDSHGYNIMQEIVPLSSFWVPDLKLQIPVSCARPWAGHPQSLAAWAILPQKGAHARNSFKKRGGTMACISVPNIFCSWVGIAGALLLLSKNIVRIAEKKRFSKKYGWSNSPLETFQMPVLGLTLLIFYVDWIWPIEPIGMPRRVM